MRDGVASGDKHPVSRVISFPQARRAKKRDLIDSEKSKIVKEKKNYFRPEIAKILQLTEPSIFCCKL